MARAVIFLFPGQSSRDAEMFRRIDTIAPGAGTAAAARVSETLGAPFDGSFPTNAAVQCAVVEAELAYLRLAIDAGLTPAMSAGLSLGEYAHLVAIGALGADDARALALARGRCYDDGPEGVMAAVFPIDPDVAERLAASVRDETGDPLAVAVSNFNSPTQTVVAGARAAVELVLERAQEEHWAGGTIIEQHVPMHTPRFRPVVPCFRAALERTVWRVPHADYWPNVDAAPIAHATPDAIIERLARHVCEPVKWRQTIDAALARFGDPVFVEVGPLQVLTKLLSRKWIGQASAFALDLMDEAERGRFARRLDAIRDAAA